MGNLEELKIKLKKMVLGDEGKVRAYAMEKFMGISPNKGKAYTLIIMLMVLKLIKNAVLKYIEERLQFVFPSF